MRGLGSAPHQVPDHGGDPQRAADRLLLFWVAIMLLTLGGGYLLVRLLSQGSPQAQTATETLNPTQAASSPPSNATASPAPTESPAITETVPPSLITYTVQQGDTLLSIAGQFGVGLPTLTALNPSVTPELLNIGDQLVVPVPGSSPATTATVAPGERTVVEYEVASGDTLAAIAARFGSTIEAIVRENNLENPNQIRSGQTLRIPVEADASPTATPQS